MTNPGFKKVADDRDSYLLSVFPTINNGSATFISIDNNLETVGVIKFDLSAIPSNATITSAKIFLTCSTGTTGVTTQLHRLLRDWTENGVNWNTTDGSIAWGTAGAKSTVSDYDSTLLGTLTWTSVNDTIEADITALVVEDWINGTNPNYGFRLSPVSSVTTNYHSKEVTTQAFKPFMEIHYTYPQMDFQINSTAINAGIQATWPPMVTGQNADATQKINTTWYEHLWRCEFMEMAEWEVLEPLKGPAFSELKTTDQDTPNSGNTYSTGRVMDVTGRQVGRRMVGVAARFLVDITS